MTRLHESPFEWKARHSSASVPKCHNTMNTILRRALKAEINLKEAEMAYSRDLYYVARYVHVHAYDVKACCDNWVCVHKITLHLQLCYGGAVDRHANITIFWFLFFFRWRAFKPHNFTFCLSNFFFIPCCCCFGLVQFLPTCFPWQISDGTPFSH